jgi:hypothetical protein
MASPAAPDPTMPRPRGSAVSHVMGFPVSWSQTIQSLETIAVVALLAVNAKAFLAAEARVEARGHDVFLCIHTA